MASSANAGTPRLQKRSVVSSFIIKEPTGGAGGKPMVALFKRGGQVSTYQHHWAPISGGIDATDASPLAAAWRELNEETTLTPASLELLRQGKSYTFADASVGREWTIYPFAYRLKADESAIQIDWEHEDWAWFDPLEVEDTAAFGGVPHLATSLRRAWFEKDLGSGSGSAGDLLARGLERLRTDYESGARQLAVAALETLRDVVEVLDVGADTAADTGAIDVWWAAVRLAAWHLWKNGRESMGAAILSVLLDALAGVEATLGQGSLNDVRRAAIQEQLDPRIAQRAGASSAEPVSRALLAHLEQHLSTKTTCSILTLSESSTIAYALQQLVSRSPFTTIDLRVLESRPLFEGVSLAASLVHYAQSASASASASASGADVAAGPSTRVEVTVYTDASAAMAAEGVDIVLLGADRIAASGAVSNKTGSLPAVLAAKWPVAAAASTASHEARHPPQVIVLGETDKIAMPGDPREHVVEDNGAAQLVRGWQGSFNSQRVQDAAGVLAEALKLRSAAPVDVRVRNVFFEWVPPELVDVYVTEKGVWTVDDIGRHSTALGRDEAKFFGDL